VRHSCRQAPISGERVARGKLLNPYEQVLLSLRSLFSGLPVYKNYSEEIKVRVSSHSRVLLWNP
jgi:hypothetical protein